MSFAAREESIVLEDLLITWPKPDHTRSEGVPVVWIVCFFALLVRSVFILSPPYCFCCSNFLFLFAVHILLFSLFIVPALLFLPVLSFRVGDRDIGRTARKWKIEHQEQR